MLRQREFTRNVFFISCSDVLCSALTRVCVRVRTCVCVSEEGRMRGRESARARGYVCVWCVLMKISAPSLKCGDAG